VIKISSLLGLALALTAAPAFAGQNSTLAVSVVDQTGSTITAGVVAIFFNNGNPDPVASQVAVTTTGVATFSPANGNALYDTDFYQIVATTQGYTPGIVAQFNNNPPGVTADPANPANLTIGLTATPGLGEMDVPVTNAAAPLIFGQVSLQGGGGAIQYGVVQTVGGNGILRFYDLAPALGNTYAVSAFDSQLNRSASINVSTTLAAGSALLTSALSFTGAPPPVTNISQSQQTGQSGTLSLSGVVTDTTAASYPVPYMQLNFSASYVDQYNQSHNDFRGAQTDQNGAFQLYGLLPGVTYYTTVFSGCAFGQNILNNGVCYQGFQDQYPNAPIANRDFVGLSTSAAAQTLTIKLPMAAASNGALAVYVTDQFGNPFPQASINLNPDGSPWPAAGSGSCGSNLVSNPGLKNINLNNVTSGYALLTGLPSGNYNLNVYSSFGQASLNAPNNTNNGNNYYQGCGSSGGPFYRLTIDTTTSPDMQVYNSSGIAVGAPSLSTTVVINVSTGTGATGLVQGTITFPSAINNLSLSPILITLFPNCSPGNPCQGGGFKVLNSALMPQTTTYSISVSSGLAYNMNIVSNYWGPVFAGGNRPQPDLTLSSTAIVNLQFAPGGRVLGYLRNTDGSAFLPPQNSGGGGTPGINANGNSSGGGTQINADGSFVLGGLLPGAYTLSAQADGFSPFPYTTQTPAPLVNIAANQDVHQDVPLTNAVTVKPVANPAFFPPLTSVVCPTNNSGGGNCPPESLNVLAYPAGSPFTTPVVISMLNGGQSNQFQFTTSTGQVNNNNCNGQFMAQAGFCTANLPANPGGTSYDFYLARMGSFDSADYAGGARPYFVVESSSKSITISQAAANSGPNAGVVFNPSSGSTTTLENVPMTPVSTLPSLPQATLSGTVTVSNIINQRQFQQLGGNFSNFLNYLPLVWVYDSSGTLKAAGMVVPYPPSEAPLDTKLNQSVTSGNYAQFQALLSGPNSWGPVGYEIRGLTAGQTYSLVATSPNYPPFKTSVTLGAAGSTTTINVDFDANTGATLTGVVNSTNAVAISGAQVTVQSSGYPATTVTTDSSGTWSLSGLSAGQYQLQVVAAGYAQASQIVNVSGSGQVSAAAFTLTTANSSISGTVYTNNPICPAGASCSAFGKTVLQGATVVAYDDTLNASNASAVLPLYRAVTNASGTYTLNGLISSDVFKVFVNDPGYYVLNQSTQTVPGALTGFDFALKPKPLSVNVFGYPAGTNYEFQITNYQRFSNGQTYIGPTVGFSTGIGGNAASVNFVPKPDSQGNTELFLDYPLISLVNGVSYTLEIIAQPSDPSAPLVISQTVFGQGIPNNACEAIDQSLLGDTSVNAQGVPANQAPLDISGGNASGMSLPVGGVIPVASTSVPSMCMNQTAANVAPSAVSAIRTSAINLSAFLSGVYAVTLSSVNYVKGVNLTLSYDQNGTDITDAAIFTFDQASQKWLSVPGLQTIDPVRGTISVQGLQSLASVLNVKSATAMGFMAVSNGRGFRPNAITPRPDDSGIFAILRPSQVNGGAFSGTIVKVYNFPNPFNLQTKSVTLNTAAGVCLGNLAGTVVTDGTVIKYEIPSGISGTGVIRVYTLSGRLVREIDAGNIQPNNCYYTTWDGKNRNGLPVANGIYYGILSVAGTKLTSGTFKLAVIK
jgi:hypothetical protein